MYPNFPITRALVCLIDEHLISEYLYFINSFENEIGNYINEYLDKYINLTFNLLAQNYIQNHPNH